MQSKHLRDWDSSPPHRQVSARAGADISKLRAVKHAAVAAKRIITRFDMCSSVTERRLLQTLNQSVVKLSVSDSRRPPRLFNRGLSRTSAHEQRCVFTILNMAVCLPPHSFRQNSIRWALRFYRHSICRPRSSINDSLSRVAPVEDRARPPAARFRDAAAANVWTEIDEGTRCDSGFFQLDKAPLSFAPKLTSVPYATP